MTTQTETALAALFAALTARCAAATPTAIPAPHRNEALPSRVAQADNAVFVWISLWDGTTKVVGEPLGADVMLLDDPTAKPYELELRPMIDVAVAGGTEANRNAMFDLVLRTINAAVSPARSGDVISYLGGAVDSAVVEEVLRDGGGTVTEGLPNVRGAQVTPLLTYLSSTPF